MRVLDNLLFQLVDAAFAVDAHRRVISWNPTCENVLGVPAREALGRPCEDVLRACDGSGKRFCGPDCSVAPLARGGAAPMAERLWFVQNDGVRRALWLSVFLVPSQWRDLWTVVHLLQSSAPAAVPLGKERTAVGKCHGSARAGQDRNGSGLPQSPSLTAREHEILRRLAHGQPAQTIARALCISAVTVRNHIQHLIAKLGLHSQIEAVAFAYRNNLVAATPQGRPASHVAGGELD
jgi:DNA-binding CsgD family transcriptional regulator